MLFMRLLPIVYHLIVLILTKRPVSSFRHAFLKIYTKLNNIDEVGFVSFRDVWCLVIDRIVALKMELCTYTYGLHSGEHVVLSTKR